MSSLFAIAIIMFNTFLLNVDTANRNAKKGKDLSSNPRIFESDSLPEEERHMASVGNGHLATIVYSETVFMNGLFNGERGDSHRARIPSRINVRISIPKREIRLQRFILDVEKGSFIERVFLKNGAEIKQITYAHRQHTPLLMTQLYADFSKSTVTSMQLTLTDNPGPDSSDITFKLSTRIPKWSAKQQIGQTNTKEDILYQLNDTEVCVIYSEVPEHVILTVESPAVTFIMSVASTSEEALEAYSYAAGLAQQGKHNIVYENHMEEWRRIWNAGNIIMEGSNLLLAKVTAGSMYYLLSSLPNEENNEKRQRFYGVSPGSLAYGHVSQDYQGHIFWDSETWMFPPVLLLWPYAAKDILLYRMANIQPARDRANNSGYQGARFPWESAATGVEVTPDCCPETRKYQLHITGDISFAARQYLAATGDINWLHGENYSFPLDVNGCDFIREMGQFWASRAKYNPLSGHYEINEIMPPDEDHNLVNNSIYTNVVAAYSIFFAKYSECVCNGMMSETIPNEWLEVARKLKYPFDNVHNYHPEFDGYRIGEMIKQADVVLLGYPIMHVTDPIVRKNDLEVYENATRLDGPAMTWSMHAIGHLELNEETKAEVLLNRSYQPYLVEPFKVWNEAQNHKGAQNCITGMGGFLQVILFGYTGFRLHLDHLSANPKLPPGQTNLTIQGLDYLGCSFNFNILSKAVFINWNGRECQELILVPSHETRKILLTERGSIQLSRKKFIIERKTAPSCLLPETQLGLGNANCIGQHSFIFMLSIHFILTAILD